MKSKPRIEVLVGMIASGKSTYSAKRAQEGAIVINDDSIVTAVHGGVYTLYSKELKPLYKSIEDHILHIAIAMGKDVIIDRGLNLARQSRVRWIALAKSLEAEPIAILFPIESPEVHAKRRTEHDSRGTSYERWLVNARHHLSVYQEVQAEEGFSEIVSSQLGKTSYNVERVISGGQTGADQGGLQAAYMLKIPTGGWIPKGFRTEKGASPELKVLGLTETETDSYVPRTRLNAKDSDGTIRIASNWGSVGEKCTLKGIRDYNKPYVDVDPKNDFSEQVETVKAWFQENDIRIVNIAGNRESKSPGIQEFTVKFLLKVFEDFGYGDPVQSVGEGERV